jgi:hypothetical protein
MTEYCEYFLVKYLIEKFNLKKFLLYGTGDTKTFDMLTDEGADVTGCDLSPFHKHGRPKFYTPDELPGKYDGIIAVDVFEHFSEPKKYFELLINKLLTLSSLKADENLQDKPQGISSGVPPPLSDYLSMRHNQYHTRESPIDYIKPSPSQFTPALKHEAPLRRFYEDNGILAGMTNFYMGGPIDDGWVRPAGVVEKGWNPGFMSSEGHLCYWSIKSIQYLVEKHNLYFSKFLRTMDNPDESRVNLANSYVFFIYKNKSYKEVFDELEKKSPTLHIFKD